MRLLTVKLALAPQLVESKLHALISRRLERLGRFRTTVRTMWDLLSEPAEKTMKMEVPPPSPSHVNVVHCMTRSASCRLEF